MKSLISRALSENPERLIENITPESAGWKFVGFYVFKRMISSKTCVFGFSKYIGKCFCLISDRVFYPFFIFQMN